MKLSPGRHAFITGGASGIGLGVADALVGRGLKVTLADIHEEQLAAVISERGDASCRPQTLDTRDLAAWRQAKSEAENAFGPVDILLNNAGIAPIGVELADTDPSWLASIIAVNLTGVFNGVAVFAAEMRARKCGHIVNTSSMCAIMINQPGVGAYAISKFGVLGLSEQLRVEMAPHGVGVSALCPGYVETNLVRNTIRIAGDIGAPAMTLPSGKFTPRQIGEIVADGIEQNSLYIVTHPARWPVVESRNDGLREAFRLAATRLA